MKKVVLGTLLVGLIGILVAGAIIRTLDKTENVAEARGLGRGYGSSEELGTAHGTLEQDRGGKGQGRLQRGDELERQYPNYEDTPDEWVEYQGTVVQAPADGEELVVQTVDGEQVTVGTGPGYMADQGFSLDVGEKIEVLGYWEDGELKASELTRTRDGETIRLRDELGRPAWAGNGRRALEQSAQTASGYGSGTQGNGYGRQASGGNGRSLDARGPEEATGAFGEGQASVEEWLSFDGTVVGVDDGTLIIDSPEGQVTIQNRAWWFAQDQGFTAQVGDRLTLRGFYEGDDFEVGSIVNHTSEESVLIREESGRPQWAGGGRRGR